MKTTLRLVEVSSKQFDIGTNTWETRVLCKGFFHEWGMNYEEFENGGVPFSVGIVELQNGEILLVEPTYITFLD